MGSVNVEVKRLQYVYEDKDRHGNVRLYFWRGKGHPKFRIRERIGSPAFYDRYAALRNGQSNSKRDKPHPPHQTKTATFRWLCLRFYEFADCTRLNPRTQYTTRRILESCCAEPIAPSDKDTFADFPLEQMTTDVLEILRDRKGDLLGAADNRVKAIRRLFKWGKRKRLISSNNAGDVEYVGKDTGGWHPWTQEELERYERRHPTGTMARLALDLIQFTGLSRMDVVRVGACNIKTVKSRKRVLSYSRGKTNVAVELAMAKSLTDAIARCQIVGSQTFLLNGYGRPFTVSGFGNKFRQWCDEAGLPQCSAHGLRKAAATRAAENGATTHELMAMFGWLTVKQAELYTRAADRRKLAARAGTFLER